MRTSLVALEYAIWKPRLLRYEESSPDAIRIAKPRLRYEVGSSAAGSTHLPCSRIKSFNRSTASASGILNFTAVLPT